MKKKSEELSILRFKDNEIAVNLHRSGTPIKVVPMH